MLLKQKIDDPQTTEKIFTKHISDKGLYAEIKNPISKWAKERHFTKEDMQIIKNLMKKYSSLLIT